MATRTLKAKYETLDGSVTQNRSILCHAKNVKEIYYQYEDEVKAPASSGETVGAPSDYRCVASTAPIAATTTVSAPSSGPVVSIEDNPIKPIDILLVIIAQKLKKGMDQIPLSKTIKDLGGGRSTLQNEIFGISSKSSPRLLKKAKSFLLKNWVQLWEAGLVVHLVNTARASFLV